MKNPLNKYRYKNALSDSKAEAWFMRAMVVLCFLFIWKQNGTIENAKAETLVRVQTGISESKARPGWLAPDVYIYEFALTMWQKMNHWNDGSKDYPINVAKYQAYFTHECREYLESDIQIKSESGELRNRERVITELVGLDFDPRLVRLVGIGQWEVALKTTVKEYANNELVKHLDINYPVKIVDYNVDSDINPWELAIDCFYERPKVVKDHINSRGY